MSAQGNSGKQVDIVILDGCCMALEACEVIARHVNREDYSETRNKLLMRYGARHDEEAKADFCRQMDLIAQVYSVVQDRIPDTPETEFLFRKYYYGNTYSILAQVILFNFHDIRADGVAEYLSSSRQRWKKAMNSKVHLASTMFSALVLEPAERPWRELLFEDIDRLDYPFEFKWNLYKVLSDFETYAGWLEKILLSVEDVLGEALKVLDPVAEESREYWKERLTPAAMEYITEAMRFERDNVKGKQVLVRLLRMPCDQAVMDDQWDKKCLPAYFGVALKWGNPFEGPRIDRHLLCEELKVLSEDSKFEILQSLKQEGSYGQEIARRVGLDAATVSRHLAVLQRHGLVYVERREGRNIYFRTNQNELRNLLELLERIFLS